MTHNPSIARTEIVFVFDNLPDWQQLAAGVRAGVQARASTSTCHS